MIYNLFTYFDRVAGVYSAPVPAINEASAIRAFNNAFSGNPNAGDMDLYWCGTFNVVSGEFTGCSTPAFVARYELSPGGAE